MQHRTPLTIDFNEALKCNLGESPDLVITGAEHLSGYGKRDFFLHYFASEDQRFPSGQPSDQSEEDRIAGYTDDDLKRNINKYRNHLKSGLNLKDRGEKIRRLLEKLIQEQKRRQRRENEVSIDCDQDRRENSMSPSGYTGTQELYAKISNNVSKGDLDSGHRMKETSAFHIEIGAMKGCLSNVHPHQIVERNKSECGRLLDGERTTTLLLPNSQRGETHTSAWRRVLGKRTNTGDEHDLNHANAKVLPDSIQACTIKKSVKEVDLKKPQVMTTWLSKKDCIGSSLNTAMELSDDEVEMEEGNQETGYHSSSNFQREEGFKIAYPRGDPEAVEVQESDLRHLEPYEFLNDTVIDFYIKYIQRPDNLSNQKRARFHFFNSFFFKKLLLEKKQKDSDYYSKLRKWVRGINIFEKYLIIPVHDSAHWSLAIVCFSMEESSRLQPYIFHLDSMREGHATDKITHVLESYLKAEWTHKGDIYGVGSWCEVLVKRVDVPLQQNAWDCGLFLLFFIQRFVEEAPSVFTADSMKSMFGRNWFKPQEASSLRQMMDDVTLLTSASRRFFFALFCLEWMRFAWSNVGVEYKMQVSKLNRACFGFSDSLPGCCLQHFILYLETQVALVYNFISFCTWRLKCSIYHCVMQVYVRYRFLIVSLHRKLHWHNFSVATVIQYCDIYLNIKMSHKFQTAYHFLLFSRIFLGHMTFFLQIDGKIWYFHVTVFWVMILSPLSNR